MRRKPRCQGITRSKTQCTRLAKEKHNKIPYCRFCYVTILEIEEVPLEKYFTPRTWKHEKMTGKDFNNYIEGLKYGSR